MCGCVRERERERERERGRERERERVREREREREGERESEREIREHSKLIRVRTMDLHCECQVFDHRQANTKSGSYLD